MKGEYTLLECLEEPRRARLGGELDASKVLESVIANLSNILNTREGSVMARPDYGMPDFNDVVSRFPDALAIIAKSIRYQIVEFEPRLQHAVIRHIPDPNERLTLRYAVVAELIVGDSARRVSVETSVEDDGHVFVRI